jgi:hypothetical protein
MPDLKHCLGCRDDFYNDKNPLGVKRCWSFEKAQIVERWRIGTWVQPDSVDCFSKVTTHDCHHEPGQYAFYSELPEHLRRVSVELWVDDVKPQMEKRMVDGAYSACAGSAATRPARGLLLVRPVETDETLPGGRILLTHDARERMTANQCEVLAVGNRPLCDERDADNEDCMRAHEWEDAHTRVHPCKVHVGDWLLVTPRSFVAGPEPERLEWYVHQDAVLAILSEENA